MIFDDASLRLRDPERERVQAQRRQRLLTDLGPDLWADQEWDQAAAEVSHAFAVDLGHHGQAPHAMVNLVGADEQWFVGLYTPPGLAPVERTMPGNHGYCREVLDRGSPLVLADTYGHPHWFGNVVVDQIGIRTYAAAPLYYQPPPGTQDTEDTEPIMFGTVCIVGTEPRPRSTNQASYRLIKRHRDGLMTRLNQRIGQLTRRRTARRPQRRLTQHAPLIAGTDRPADHPEQEETGEDPCPTGS